MERTLQLERLVLVKVVIKNILILPLIFILFLNLSCDLLEPNFKNINCDWFQYSNETIFDCEDVYWCDNMTYGGKKVKRIYILHNGNEPKVDNEFYKGGVDVVLYESMKTKCIEYNKDVNEIGIINSEYLYSTLDVSESIIAYKATD